MFFSTLIGLIADWWQSRKQTKANAKWLKQRKQRENLDDVE